MKLLSPPYSRADFLALSVGHLLADYLAEAPRLVFRERDVFKAACLEELLPEVRARVAGGYKVIARAKSEHRDPTEARATLAGAIRQLKRLHRELVTLARGYAYPALVFAATGTPFVCMFDSEDDILSDMLCDEPHLRPPVQYLYTAPPSWDVTLPEALICDA